MHKLLHSSSCVDEQALRALALTEVTESRLITECADGGKDAANALLIGFWPFVYEFEQAIDRRRLPRRPLQKKFGQERTVAFFESASETLREMKVEEGGHATAWKNGAESLGIVSLEGPIVDAVQKLLDSSYTDDLVQFFSVLAGTEFIAEELSRRLVNSPKFTKLFPKKRWIWGDIHLLDHDGPSHLDIDLDLARAYADGEDKAAKSRIESEVTKVIRLFGMAADQVLRLYSTRPPLRIAA